MKKKTRKDRLVEIFKHRRELGKKLPKTLRECVYQGGANDYDMMLALLCLEPNLAPHPTFECGSCRLDPVNTQHEYDIKRGNVPAIAVTLFNTSPADFVGISRVLLNNEAQRQQLNKLLSRN